MRDYTAAILLTEAERASMAARVMTIGPVTATYHTAEGTGCLIVAHRLFGSYAITISRQTPAYAEPITLTGYHSQEAADRAAVNILEDAIVARRTPHTPIRALTARIARMLPA